MKTKLFLMFFALIACAGCGDKVQVKGRVVFSDGNPLTTGIVYFESGPYQAYGILDADGNYSVGEIRPGDGIKKGDYRVRVSATSGGTSDGAPFVRHIANKYENVETSELNCAVAGKTRFDIQVEKP